MKRIIRIVIICSFLLTALGVVPALADPDDPPPVFLPLLFRSPTTFLITGTVKDSGNFPIAGVLVTDAHGKTATTDLNGAYSLAVPQGTNTLTATRSGYDIDPVTINVTTSLAGVNFSAQVGCGNIVYNEQVTSWMGGWDFLTDQEDDVVPGTDAVIFQSAPSSGRVGINPGVDANIASTTRARSQLYHIPSESDADAVFLGVYIYEVNTGAGAEFDRQYIDLVDQDGDVHNLYTSFANTAAWTYHEFPLDDFLGETVRIQFRVLNSGGSSYATMYFDDVQLVICNTHCDNRILNGGFETLPPAWDSGWLYNAEAIINPWYSSAPDPVHSGSYSMQTGIPPEGTLSIVTGLTYFDLESSSEVWQRNITLPADQSGGLLTFWIYRTRLEGVPPPGPVAPSALGPSRDVLPSAGPTLRGPLAPTATPEEDWVYVYIYDDEGDFLAKPIWQRATNDAIWIRYSVDLSDYMGQQIELLFGTYNDGKGGPSAMWIDDVVVGTCD